VEALAHTVSASVRRLGLPHRGVTVGSRECRSCCIPLPWSGLMRGVVRHARHRRAEVGCGPTVSVSFGVNGSSGPTGEQSKTRASSSKRQACKMLGRDYKAVLAQEIVGGVAAIQETRSLHSGAPDSELALSVRSLRQASIQIHSISPSHI